MINVKVLNIRDVLKYLVKLTIIILIIVGIARYFSNLNIEKQNISLIKIELDTGKIRKKIIENCFQNTLPLLNKKDHKRNIDETYIEKILNMELGMTKNIKIKKEDLNIQNNIEKNKAEEIEEAEINVKTEVIEDSTIYSKYTNMYGNVQIRNESSKELTEEILNPNIVINNTKDILIYHTHTCESYTPSTRI